MQSSFQLGQNGTQYQTCVNMKYRKCQGSLSTELAGMYLSAVPQKVQFYSSNKDLVEVLHNSIANMHHNLLPHGCREQCCLYIVKVNIVH